MKLSSIKETTMTRVSNKEDIDSTTIKETNSLIETDVIGFLNLNTCHLLI
jgi:hypothetical protein